MPSLTFPLGLFFAGLCRAGTEVGGALDDQYDWTMERNDEDAPSTESPVECKGGGARLSPNDSYDAPCRSSCSISARADLRSSNESSKPKRMKIGCLQFTPCHKNPAKSLEKVESLLSRHEDRELESLDLLILPEMALTGYTFASKQDIEPFIENTENFDSSPSLRWARQAARRLSCTVAIGFPRRNGQGLFNSLALLNPSGDLITVYDKHFLFETDESWAQEGSGFSSLSVQGLGRVGVGICMDVNPCRFEAPFEAFEFAHFQAKENSELLILSMAWLRNPSESASNHSLLDYWLTRLLPWIQQEQRVDSVERRRTVAICNRTGAGKHNNVSLNNRLLKFGARIEGVTFFAGQSVIVTLEGQNILSVSRLSSDEEGLLIANANESQLLI